MKPIGLVAAILCLLSACGRSAEDRRLDALFAHQAALRDTTGTIVGKVVHNTSGAPLAGVHISADYMGGMSDSSGRFTIPYVNAGVTEVRAYSRGYVAFTDTIVMTPPDTIAVSLTLVEAPGPCCELTGRWEATFHLDSAGYSQTPQSRQVVGIVAISPRVGEYLGTAGVYEDGRLRSEQGLTTIDFSPFWGARIAPDVSTTVFGHRGGTFGREAVTQVFFSDSVAMIFIPRISHGGVSLAGRIDQDTITGKWYQRAYAGGAYGVFRMVRLSHDPEPLNLPPKPPSPPPVDTLPEAARGDVRVRVWDEAQGKYLQTRHGHALEEPDGSIKSVYSLGTEEEGWGPSFWLPPGGYAILFSQYPCGDKRYILKNKIRKEFEVKAGEDVEVTIRINTLKLKPRRTYDNTDGRRCTAEQQGLDEGEQPGTSVTE